MTNEVAERISEKIVVAFPTEAKGTYFIQGVKRKYSINKKSIAA